MLALAVSTLCSNSLPHGNEAAAPPSELAGSTLILPGSPSHVVGRLSGKAYCLSDAQKSAFGKVRANGPANTLCSGATEGSTTCFTGPCASMSGWSNARHSAVGATGA